jgi:hypothetical protein
MLWHSGRRVKVVSRGGSKPPKAPTDYGSNPPAKVPGGLVVKVNWTVIKSNLEAQTPRLD